MCLCLVSGRRSTDCMAHMTGPLQETIGRFNGDFWHMSAIAHQNWLIQYCRNEIKLLEGIFLAQLCQYMTWQFGLCVTHLRHAHMSHASISENLLTHQDACVNRSRQCSASNAAVTGALCEGSAGARTGIDIVQCSHCDQGPYEHRRLIARDSNLR